MKKVPYIPSAYPFKDYVLIYGEHLVQDAQVHDVLTEISPIKEFLRLRSLHGNAVAFMEGAHQNDQSARCTVVSGYGQKFGQLFFGPNEGEDVARRNWFQFESPALDAVPLGNYSVMLWRGNAALFASDPFGMSPTFYYSSGRGVVVSNSYHLLLLTVRRLVGALKVDHALLTANVLGKGTFFKQHFTHSMPVRGIRMLPVNRVLRIDARGVNEDPYACVDLALRPDPDHIEAHLDAGANDVLNNLLAVYNAPHVSNTVLHMSGGKDSRAVLAAISHLGRDYIERTPLHIKSNTGRKDIEVASGISNFLDCRLYSGTTIPYWQLLPSYACEHWRSAKMGTYYRLGAGSRSNCGGGNDTINLSGGGGENLSSFWWERYHKLLPKSGSIEAFADKLCRRYLNGHAIHADTLETIKAHVVDSFNETPGDSLLDKLDLNYLFFRNRLHFGMKQYNTFHENPQWFPLLSLNLLKAARSETHARRRSFSVILRVTDHFSPDLPWIPYDDGLTLGELDTSPLPGHSLRKRTIIPDNDISRWRHAKRLLQEAEEKRRCEGILASGGDRTFSVGILEEMRAGISTFVESLQGAGINNLVDDHLLERVERHSESRGELNYIYAKLASAYDQLTIIS